MASQSRKKVNQVAEKRDLDAVETDNLIVKGDSSFFILQSKKAMRKKLKGREPHKKVKNLRDDLKHSIKHNPNKADAAWERAVNFLKEKNDLPSDGKYGVKLDKILAPYWPRDSVGRRIIRKTPAWKLIPGQLSPNFNIREFACHDGTGYIEGLIKCKGLSRDQAWSRAKENAKRLEKVRKEEKQPIRLTSVYRTDSYNARIGGASNSAHTRGFANDIPPGKHSLSHHKSVMRNCFESGIGYYPQLNFVHGDFDPTLGRREWIGP